MVAGVGLESGSKRSVGSFLASAAPYAALRTTHSPRFAPLTNSNDRNMF
jgi:hypothetical protein